MKKVKTLELLAKSVEYAGIMEKCAAYIAFERPVIREPESVYRLIKPLYGERHAQQESFFVILLDTKNRVIDVPVEASRGLLDSSPVHPREVFRAACIASAASVVLVHNHPSGDPTPSKEDIDITRRLVEAARILGIRVVDHVIIGYPSNPNMQPFVSLREKNLVSFE